jgi:hypothetical protein
LHLAHGLATAIAFRDVQRRPVAAVFRAATVNRKRQQLFLFRMGLH